MEDGHTRTVAEVERYFNVDSQRGLSEDQVKRNQEKYGPNGTCRWGRVSERGGRRDGTGWRCQEMRCINVMDE